ncbi:unnamed protein product [Parascedosporium putredinis]|uniref:Heterokaryon incompatibility domain-containing protein n=1 Tax=Parascedosporium putredinis TaxID=1442378 RepID=A0A9P1M6H6_9PEZI|nr:unnamed protein product [Parascedosporium putredinis]CAI7988429.1 unnamed protein product [Parascedosporium putredinis]
MPQMKAFDYAKVPLGQATGKLQISDGTSLPITLALETALRGLREPEPFNLWIDQICINQDDSDEKDRQIPLMKDIYTRSSCTIAWLGLAASSTEKATRYLTRTGEAFASLGLGPVTKQLQEQL